MNALTNNIIFGLFLSGAAFYGLLYLRVKRHVKWANPLLGATILIIFLLIVLNIPLDNYMKGGNVINAFLGPATIVLAVPLYRQRKTLFEHKYAILGGIVAGVLAGFFTTVGMSKLLHIAPHLQKSFYAHSVTTPIGIGISKSLNVNQSITVLTIIATGILGAFIVPHILKILHIKHPVPRGLAYGTSSHVMGTTRAIEEGTTQGAISSLAISVAAITTIIVVFLLSPLIG